MRDLLRRGDSESLLAIANVFECEIEVFRENGFRTVVTNDRALVSAVVRLVYRGTTGRWDHYDSFMGFIDDDAVVKKKFLKMSRLVPGGRLLILMKRVA